MTASSSPGVDTSSQRGTRRRGPALTSAIYLATFSELAETGFETLSFDKVATRAGTGKASLYRRWTNPAELVLDALTDPEAGFGTPGMPDTGSLRSDLFTLLTRFAQALHEPRGRALLPLLTQRARHPDLYDQVCRLVVLPHKEIILACLRAAVERGEAAPEAVIRRVAGVGPRLVIAESMELDTVTGVEIEAIVDDVLLPLAAPRPRSH